MKNKNYIFNWQKNGRNSIVRNNTIQAVDAKTATDCFMKEFGNLKKNTINYIQEVDMEGNPIGEKIVSD